MEPFFFFDSSSSPHNPSDVEALRRLSDSLLLLRLSPSDSFSDLTIAVRSSDPPRDLVVHRCILSARSPFFRLLLPGTTERLDLGEILPCFDAGFDALVLVVGYLYSGKVGPLPRGVCECADEDCRHVACRPAVEFMAHVLFAASGFEISELVSLFQVGFLGKSLDYHLANLDNWVAPTKIAMANKTLIPSLTAAKFPDLEVNLPDGGSLKLPIIPGKYATDTSERIIPSVSLFCLSFRANSQAMTSSWSAPFLGAFSPSGEVQVYEVSFIDSWYMSLGPLRRMFLKMMKKSSSPQKQVVYSFGDNYDFRKELQILNLLTAYIFVIDKSGKIRWQGYGWATDEELSHLLSCTSLLLDGDKAE